MANWIHEWMNESLKFKVFFQSKKGSHNRFFFKYSLIAATKIFSFSL